MVPLVLVILHHQSLLLSHLLRLLDPEVVLEESESLFDGQTLSLRVAEVREHEANEDEAEV